MEIKLGPTFDLDNGWTKRRKASDKSTVRVNLQRMAYYLEIIRHHVNQDPFWGSNGGSYIKICSNCGFQPRAYINDGPHSWRCIDWYGREGSRKGPGGVPYSSAQQKQVFGPAGVKGKKGHDGKQIKPDWDGSKWTPRPRVNPGVYGVFGGEGGNSRNKLIAQARKMPLNTPVSVPGSQKTVELDCKKEDLLNDNGHPFVGCRCKQAKMSLGPWPKVQNPTDVDSRGKGSQHRKGAAMDIVVWHKTKKIKMDPVMLHHKIQELILAGCIPEGGLGLYAGSNVHYDFRGITNKWKGGNRDTKKWIRYFEHLGRATHGLKYSQDDIDTMWRNRYDELQDMWPVQSSFYDNIAGGDRTSLLPLEDLLNIVKAPNYYKDTPLWKRFIHWNAGRHPIPGEDLDNISSIIQAFVQDKQSLDNYGYGSWDYTTNQPGPDYMQNLKILMGLSNNKKHTFTLTIDGVTTKRTFRGLGCTMAQWKPNKDARNIAQKHFTSGRFKGKSNKASMYWVRKGNDRIYQSDGTTRPETPQERSERGQFPVALVVMSCYYNIMQISHNIKFGMPTKKKNTPLWEIIDLQNNTYSDVMYNAWLQSVTLNQAAPPSANPAGSSYNSAGPATQAGSNSSTGSKLKSNRGSASKGKWKKGIIKANPNWIFPGSKKP